MICFFPDVTVLLTAKVAKIRDNFMRALRYGVASIKNRD